MNFAVFIKVLKKKVNVPCKSASSISKILKTIQVISMANQIWTLQTRQDYQGYLVW